MAENRREVEYGEFSWRRKKRPGGRFFGLLVFLSVLGLLLIVLSPFLCYFVKVDNGAMSPSINISDTVGVNQLAYLLLRPGRGDIVQFQTSRREGTSSSSQNPTSIRRIIGLPGETVQILDGIVYINGRPLREEYTSGEMTYGGMASSALTLSSDEYFLMADNRSNHFDSRDSTVGPVTETEIVGKVWLRVKPYSQFGLIG